MANRWNVGMLRRILALVALALTCAACDGPKIYSSPGIEGKVTDRETGRPIERAIVVITWGGSAHSWATGAFICLHVAHAATNTDGRYRVDGWKSHAPQMFVDSFNWSVDAYKSGYGESHPPTQVNLTLSKWTSTQDEWIEFLAVFAGRNDCLEDEGEGRKLGAALHRRLQEDVEQSGASAANKAAKLQYFRRRIQLLEGNLQ